MALTKVTTGGLPSPLTTEVSLGDNVKAKFGASDDLQIYHDGSNSYVNDVGNGDLVLKTAGNAVQMWAGGDAMFTAIKDGAVTLFYDNAPKLATTSTGIDVNGTIDASQEVKAGSYEATDSGLTNTQGQFREHHYWGSWSASQSRTHVLEGANYCQYEVVYTCYRTNSGVDNNLYIRGIWTSNHTAHHWKELENVGFVEGNTFSIVVSAASPSTTATRLTITKSAGGGQGGWSMKVTAIGANSTNPTHSVT